MRWATVAAAAALMAAAATVYDPRAFAPFYVAEVVLVTSLALALLVLVFLGCRPRRRGLSLDALDACALAFAVWQLATVAFSPAPLVARFGSYGVGHGAVFWATVMIVLVAGRRLIVGVRFPRVAGVDLCRGVGRRRRRRRPVGLWGHVSVGGVGRIGAPGPGPRHYGIR